MVRKKVMLHGRPRSKTAKSFCMFCITVFFLLVLAIDSHAFETGDNFVPHNTASRFMRRYEQMGNNEHITYPVRVYGTGISDIEAEEFIEHMSVAVSYMTESMYNHYGFMVKSVTFTLEANSEGPSTSGDPMPLNIQVGNPWAMGYANNNLFLPESWALNPDYTTSGLYHEFAHHFLLRHLDLNDGYFPRSTMDTPSGDVPTEYLCWGGDDLAGAIHMWRYTNDPDAPQCPEFYTLETVGVTSGSFPDAQPYPEGTWRCDPDREDRYGMQLQNIEDGRCVEGPDSNDGTNASMAACNYEDTKQQWDLLADDDGSFRIRNVDNGKCMQVRDGSLSSGAIIEQHTCNAATSDDAIQKFYPIADGSGNYSLRVELGGRFVEVSGDGVIQETPNGANIQRWNISSDIDTE
ncbi:MAG: RICIN domain-containing protein [Desulfobacteraceae bacterium]|nr:RICIN domain-containing protein [Desulfobacteraceae bacterium]